MKYALNRIQTPDGTILTSYHVYDYVTHEDKNGEQYMVDGGLYYLKRNVNEEEYKELSVEATAPFETIRESFHWGSYGKEGKGPRRWLLLKDMETNHIKAILENNFGSGQVRDWFKQELKYREEHDML